MSKSLEVLKTIRYIHDSEHGQDKAMNENFDTIEKELKALDIIKKRISPLGRVSFMPMSQEEYKIIQEVLNSET